MRALVVDDEPLARRRLRDLVALVPWITLVGEARDGLEARAMIEALRPELVFLDVQMPGLAGTDLLRLIEPRPAVVFTTAYDRHAVDAFELQAVDYLLKPFGRARFLQAVERVRERAGERGLARVMVRDRGRIVPLQTERIERLAAEDDYVALHVAGRSHLVHVPLAELLSRLDPRRFVRVHRSHAVNLDFVAAVRSAGGGPRQVEMKSGDRVPVSRTRARELRRLTL